MSVIRHQTPSIPISRRIQKVPSPTWLQSEVDRRRIAVACMVITPQAHTDDEGTYMTVSRIMKQAAAIAKEENVRLLRRPHGLLLVAGTPIMHENDIERATYAAWRLVHAITETVEYDQAMVAIRGGISCGDAVASCAETHDDSGLIVFGTPVDMAAALASSAAPGQIWVSAAIARQCAHAFSFDAMRCESSGAVGDTQEGACLLAAALAPPFVDGAQATAYAPLTGREYELMQAQQFVRSLPANQGGYLWVTGETGIGKSRFLAEISTWLEGEGIRVLRGECMARRQNQAFALFGSLLTYLLNVPQDVPEPDIRDYVAQIAAAYLDDNQLDLLTIQMIVGVAPDGAGRALLSGLSSEQLQQAMFSAVYRLFGRLSCQPLAFLLDNLQWIDPWSGELFKFLSSLTGSSRLIFFCAAEQDADTPQDDNILHLADPHAARSLHIHLAPLDARDSGRLLDRLTAVQLPADIRSQIIENSRGNPYHIDAYVRMLIESGDLARDGASLQVEAAPDLHLLRLPDSLEALIRSRFARLDKQHRDVLRFAAVLGQPFTSDFIAKLSAESQIEPVLDDLKDRGLLLYDPSAHTWRISHATTEHVIYQSLLSVQCSALHGQIAGLLLLFWGASLEPHAGEIAHHHLHAGNLAGALDFFVMAGEWAARVRGTREAISHFEQAAAVAAQLPESATELRWRLCTGLGDVYRIAGHYAAAERTLALGLGLASEAKLSPYHTAVLLRIMGEVMQAQGQPDTARTYFTSAQSLLSNAGDEMTAQRESIYCQLRIADTHFMQGELRLALDRAQEALACATRCSCQTEAALAQNMLGGISYRRGELESSLLFTQDAVETFRTVGFTWGVASAENNLGIIAVADGRWREAAAHFATSLDLCQKSGNLAGTVIANQNLGLLHRDKGEYEIAAYYLDIGRKIAEAHHMNYHVISLLLGMAQVQMTFGRSKDAQAALNEAKMRAQSVSAIDLTAEALYVEAEILSKQADWERALHVSQQAAICAAEIGHRRVEVAAWRLAARCALESDQLVWAKRFVAYAQSALALLSDRLESGRVQRCAGQVDIMDGLVECGKGRMLEASAIFAELGAMSDLSEVDLFLAI